MAAQLKVIGSEMASSSGMDRQKALEAALAQIDRAFGKGSAMKLGSREKIEIETISTGSLGLGHCAWRRRPAAGAHHRDLWARELGQDDAGAACDSRGAEEWRHRCLRRRRACARSGLRQEAWRRHRRADRVAAGHGRAGSRSSTRWCGRTPSMCWWWTRSPRWFRAPRSRARWATATSACRRA